jgi:hypothetical protein
MTGTRPPFQGDSLGDVFPGLKPMGYSVFALRAMQNVQTPGAEGATGLKPGVERSGAPGTDLRADER